jgi:hypothetical protein
MMNTKLGFAALFTVLLLGFPTRAEAYLDPTTGSMVLQILIGGGLAALAAVKLYWKKITSLVRRGQQDRTKTTAA